jgi:anti-sigma B factor antagonist
MYTSEVVTVMEVPARLNYAEAGTFLGRLQPLLQSGRARIVLDCSQVRYVDSAGVEALSRCVHEALRRNGDLKLAAVSPASRVVMELILADCLFETFETTGEAVQSFHSIPSHTIPQSWPFPGVFGPLVDFEVAR